MKRKKILIILGVFFFVIIGLIIFGKLTSFPAQYDHIPVNLRQDYFSDPYFKTSDTSIEINHLKKVFQDFPEKIEDWTKKGLINGGEVFVVKEKTIIHHSCAGFKDIHDGEDYLLNTICRIRSMTKPLIGTIGLQLIEQKKLSLNDTISKFLPIFLNSCTSKIKIQDLYYHTSGYNQILGLNFNSLKMHVDSIAKMCPEEIPGEKFQYSDINTAILARVIEELTGNQIEDILYEKIFVPLQLVNTSTRLDSLPREKISSTHIQLPIIGIQKYWDNEDENFISYFRASGGVFSTPRDYAIFADKLMLKNDTNEHKLLNNLTISQALKAHELSVSKKKGNYGYGLHWQIFENDESKYGLIYGHSGSDGTIALVIPKYDMIICFFTQTRNGKVMEFFFNTVKHKLDAIDKSVLNY